MLAGAGALAACCLRLRSPVEFLLATYLAAWAWLVTWSLMLSPFHLLARESLFLGLALGLALAASAWIARGRPSFPPFGQALASTLDALRSPPVLVLAAAVAIGTVYIGALAFLTDVNEGDALGYHVARADFWMQEQGVGYVGGAVDPRLDVNPPNAEIAQLASMLLSGSDRYVAIGQLTAYLALAIGVAGLARRIGLSVREALFAALAFSTLPLLALQASGGLNDLVLASFLTAAAYFALGTGRATLVLVALGIALGLGTKFTGLLALPTLALVAAVGAPLRRWSALVAAGVAGLVAGSTWYVVNVVETGKPDGGVADELEQRADLGATTLITAMRLALSFVDMSGSTSWRISLLFLVGAGLLAGVGLLRLRGSSSRAIGLLGAAVVTAGVIAFPLLYEVGVRPIYKAAVLLGVPSGFLDELSWAPNTTAEPTLAWYGPLAPILLVAASATAFLAWRRRRLPALTVALAAAPWLFLATLAVSLTWDPWRGRFLIFGVALAAATWGILLRSTVLAPATAAIGSTALLLALANQENKPSGLFTELSVWRAPSSDVQKPLLGEDKVLKFVEQRVPEEANIGVALTGLHLIHPYFGPQITRDVSLLPGDTGSAPPDAQWLVLAPGASPRGCPDSWKPELDTRGWSVDRRVHPDVCFSSQRLE